MVLYLETDYSTSDNGTGKRSGCDAAADLVARIIAGLDAAARSATHGGALGGARDGVGNDNRAGDGADRDLLADAAAALGEEQILPGRVPARLRAPAPEYVPYRSLSGVGLRRLLAGHGVKVPSAGNRYPVDPGAIRARLAEQARGG